VECDKNEPSAGPSRVQEFRARIAMPFDEMKQAQTKGAPHRIKRCALSKQRSVQLADLAAQPETGGTKAREQQEQG